MKKILTLAVFCLLLSACTHTVHGMKQDIREDTNSDDDQVTVVKKTTVIHQQDLPPSPPPMQTPAQ